MKLNFKKILMFVFLVFPYFFSNFLRLSLTIVEGSIAGELDLTTIQLSSLGSAIFYTYAVMQLPTGFLTDLLSSKKLILFSCAMTAISSLLFSFGTGFSHLYVARALTGIGTAMIYVPSLAIIRKTYGDDKYATMSGIFVAMGQIGSVCASMPFKFLTDLIGWRMAYRAIGIITVIVAVGVLFMVQEPEKSVSGKKFRFNLKAAMPIAVLMIASWEFFTGGTRFSFQSLWGRRLFNLSLGFNATDASFFLMMISIGCIFGSMILGRLADKFGVVNVLIASSLLLTACWGMFAMLKEGAPYLACVILCLMLGALGSGSITVANSTLKLFVSKENTGIATGICNFCTFISSAIFTQVNGLVVDNTAGTVQHQYSVLMMVFMAVVLLANILLLVIRKQSKA